MQVKEIMITKLSTVGPQAKAEEVARKMLDLKTSHVLVVDDSGQLLGLVSGYDLRTLVAEGTVNIVAEKIMTPRDRLITAAPEMPVEEVASIMTNKNITQVPVLDDGKPVGYLNLAEVLQHTSETVKKTQNMLDQFSQAALLIDNMHEGVVVVDSDFRICEFNQAAEKISGLRAEAMIGRQSKIYMEYDSPVRTVMESGKPLNQVEVKDKEGRYFLTNNVPIMMSGQIQGVLQTVSDISEMKKMQFQLLKTRDELDKAFALTLPNSRVEYKLKSTPEYRDIYDPGTGMIQITEVIEDGGYHHVVNALKVSADLNEKGMMSVLGIDKDILVQALIFHDVGKSQPVLSVGQVVQPQKVFEQSHLHAFRSADIVSSYYNKPADVVTLIRYHHHREDELPSDFPGHLLPMYRLFKIIDGLSAGLTRRDARIGFQVNGSCLTVIENNGHPAFNRTVEVDLYTGHESVYTEKKVQTVKREALSD